MAWDPSIILGFKQYTGPDPDQTMRTLSQLGLQRVQQQQAQAQLAGYQQQQEQERALREIYRNNAQHPGDMQSALLGGGFGAEAGQWGTNQAEVASRQAAAAKAQQETMRAQMEFFARPLYGVKDQAGLNAAKQAWRNMGVPEEHIAQMPDDYAQAAPLIKALSDTVFPVEKRLEIEHRGATLDETTRHNKAMETKPSGATLILGEGGSQYFGRPGEPAKQVVDENGNPIVKPPTAGKSTAERKEWKDFTNSVTTTRGSGNKAITDLQTKLYNSERVKAAATNPDGTAKDLSPQMLTELATATAALITNGHPAESTIHALLPKGMGMKAAEMSEWLTNEPHGASQVKFVQMMLDLANREEHIITGQMRKAQVDQLANYKHLRKADPSRFDGILLGVGLDPEKFDEATGKYKLDAESGAGAAASPKAVTAYRYNADHTQRIPVYADGTQGPPEGVKPGAEHGG